MAPIAILCWFVYIWNILKISHPLLLYGPYCYPALVCAHVEHLKEFSSLLLYGPYCYPVLVCVHMERILKGSHPLLFMTPVEPRLPLVPLLLVKLQSWQETNHGRKSILSQRFEMIKADPVPPTSSPHLPRLPVLSLLAASYYLPTSRL